MGTLSLYIWCAYAYTHCYDVQGFSIWHDRVPIIPCMALWSLLLNSHILLSLFKGILYTKFCKDCCVYNVQWLEWHWKTGVFEFDELVKLRIELRGVAWMSSHHIQCDHFHNLNNGAFKRFSLSRFRNCWTEQIDSARLEVMMSSSESESTIWGFWFPVAHLLSSLSALGGWCRAVGLPWREGGRGCGARLHSPAEGGGAAGWGS